jgi:hypothetical protein
MALQPAQYHNPDTGPTRLAHDLHTTDAELDRRAEASVTARTAPRHRDDRRPVSMPAGIGHVRRGLDRVFDAIALPPVQRGGDS